MLPAVRTCEDAFEIPQFAMTDRDISEFAEELRGFHGQFADFFSRSESRENFYRYMAGQFSNLERKSIEPIALRIEGGDVRVMQHFVSDVVWEEEKMLYKYRTMVDFDMGHENGVMIFDEVAYPKKGDDSVGVSRQYCGISGKVDNCQIGVFAAYASPQGYSLVDKRLFMPEQWFGGDHREKREKCKVPKDLRFKTKPQLAAEMLREMRKEKCLRFRYVASDSIYGQSSDFIKAVEEDPQTIYFVAVANTTQCWTREPVMVQKRYRYKGEDRTKFVLDDGEKKPITVDVLAKSINDYFWYRRTVSEGTKGPIDYDFARKRVILCKDGAPDRDVWLIIRRSVSKKPEYSYFISNAPKNAPLRLFVWLAGMRWPIEQAFEECKTELGMDHYEVRKYPGWNHHILTCMLGHFFLWHTKIKLGKKSTSAYSVAA
jgi:SRSO17 transposase